MSNENMFGDIIPEPAAAADGGGSYKQYHQIFGRMYCYSDNRWVTTTNKQYGHSLYQYSTSAGAASDPLIEWENMSLYLPAGSKIKGLTILGYANDTEITDIEIHGDLRTPDATRLDGGSVPIGGGYDADNEDTHTTVHRDFYANPTGGGTAFTGGDMRDKRRRHVDLDVSATEDSLLSLYLRPVGTLTGTRYFYMNGIWEIEYPQGE